MRTRLLFLSLAAFLMSCAHPDKAVMQTLRSGLAAQYHECVPLGWNPVPVLRRYYYAGYTSEYREEGVWLHPAWLGVINEKELSDANVRTAYELLNALVRENLVTDERAGAVFHYRLTMRAMQYFFTDNRFGSNPLHLPYLCYSRIVPDRILNIKQHRGGSRVVSFDWKVSTPADWSQNPMIQEHSVILPPASEPVTAVISTSGDWTRVTKLRTQDPMLPRPVDPAVWPAYR